MEGDEEQVRLARALEELEAVHGDLELLLKEHPEDADLRPYLEIAVSMRDLEAGAPGSGSGAFRASLIEQTRRWREKQR